MTKREKAQQVACKLYEGKAVPHHSCGICVATTFGCGTRAYQSLRRGGILGEGECGALKAGEMVLGEYLGAPDPTGAVTEDLRQAVGEYRQKMQEAGHPYATCNRLTGEFADFQSDGRKAVCLAVVNNVVGAVAELLDRYGAEYKLPE